MYKNLLSAIYDIVINNSIFFVYKKFQNAEKVIESIVIQDFQFVLKTDKTPGIEIIANPIMFCKYNADLKSFVIEDMITYENFKAKFLSKVEELKEKNKIE